MLRVWVRLVLLIAGLIGAVFLFAFAFTAAAVVLLVTLAVLALFGRPVRVDWWRGQTPQTPWDQPPPHDRTARRDPLVIDHDPNDLPQEKRD